MSNILMISGKQGSGKTTLAESLSATLFYKFQHVHMLKFADPLYKIHNYHFEVLKDYGIDLGIKKDGELLQQIGTWGRKKDREIWVKCIKNKINQIGFGSNFSRLIFIDDLRFKVEFHSQPTAWKVRLECDRDIRKSRADSWRENEFHESEVDLDDYVESKFDLVLDTGKLNKEQILEAVSEGFVKQLDGKPVEK